MCSQKESPALFAVEQYGCPPFLPAGGAALGPPSMLIVVQWSAMVDPLRENCLAKLEMSLPAKPHAPAIAKSIDDMFRNSSSPTKTGTEREFQASFATMWGNVSFLMSTIGLAVVFAILLVTANAMMMSARERTGEIAVLKTVGFSDRLLFALVMVEAGAMALTGAALGLGGAKLLYPAINFNGAGFLPGFTVATSTLVIGALVAVGLMLASGLVPALRAARLPVVQALRHVE